MDKYNCADERARILSSLKNHRTSIAIFNADLEQQIRNHEKTIQELRKLQKQLRSQKIKRSWMFTLLLRFLK